MLLMVNQTNAAGSKQLNGTWKYEVSAAPYEYSNGNFIIADVDGKKVVTIKLSDGTEMKAEKVKCKDNTISFSLNIDYNEVTVSCKLDGEKLVGTADSPEGGKMELIAFKK